VGETCFPDNMERARKRQASEPADGGMDGPCGGAGRRDDGCPGVGLVYRSIVGAPVPHVHRSYAPCDHTCAGPHPHYWTSDQREEWIHRPKHRWIPIPDARKMEPPFCTPQEQKLKALDARAALLDHVAYVDQYAAERTKPLIIHTRKALEAM